MDHNQKHKIARDIERRNRAAREREAAKKADSDVAAVIAIAATSIFAPAAAAPIFALTGVYSLWRAFTK